MPLQERSMRRHEIAVVLLAAFVLTAASAAQRAPEPRVAHAAIPGPADAIALEAPDSPLLAFGAIQRVLTAAGVRYGIEAPVLDPRTPAVDLARYGATRIELGGQRL